MSKILILSTILLTATALPNKLILQVKGTVTSIDYSNKCLQKLGAYNALFRLNFDLINNGHKYLSYKSTTSKLTKYGNIQIIEEFASYEESKIMISSGVLSYDEENQSATQYDESRIEMLFVHYNEDEFITELYGKCYTAKVLIQKSRYFKEVEPSLREKLHSNLDLILTSLVIFLMVILVIIYYKLYKPLSKVDEVEGKVKNICPTFKHDYHNFLTDKQSKSQTHKEAKLGINGFPIDPIFINNKMFSISMTLPKTNPSNFNYACNFDDSNATSLFGGIVGKPSLKRFPDDSISVHNHCNF
uniref:Autophagy-related protein 27 n=1 Tax=Rhabditophanes sp. KR3021 TaxID=114890 RepID=A0AC35TKH9_9BILA